MRPLSTERGEVKTSQAQGLRKSCLLPQAPLSGNVFSYWGLAHFLTSGPLQLLYLL